MGWAFVKRRMQAELGPDWQKKFASFEHHPAAAASLGQVHRARSHRRRGARLQAAVSPTCSRRSKPICSQLGLLFAIRRRFDPAIDTTEIDQGDRRAHARGARLPPRGQARRALPRHARRTTTSIRVPQVVAGAVDRAAADARLARRQPHARAQGRRARRAQPPRHGDVHRLVVSVQPLRRDPRRSASRQLHGVRPRRASRPASTCSTTAASASSRRRSSAAWSISTTACATATTRCVVHAYETWGFKRLSRELIDILNIWARFIYGPLIDDRVRTIADGVKPGDYGRREAFEVHQALQRKGPGDGAARVRVHGPRRDRARRRVPASARRAQLPSPVRGGDRELLGRTAWPSGRRRRSSGSGSPATANSAAENGVLERSSAK